MTVPDQIEFDAYFERHVTIGCPRISSNIPDPGATALLPVDDDEWDQGVSITAQLHSLC